MVSGARAPISTTMRRPSVTLSMRSLPCISKSMPSAAQRIGQSAFHCSLQRPPRTGVSCRVPAWSVHASVSPPRTCQSKVSVRTRPSWIGRNGHQLRWRSSPSVGSTTAAMSSARAATRSSHGS